MYRRTEKPPTVPSLQMLIGTTLVCRRQKVRQAKLESYLRRQYEDELRTLTVLSPLSVYKLVVRP